MNKDKKKFKDTKVGKWLGQHAPSILDGVSELTPDAGILAVVADAVRGKEDIAPEDKLEFERLKVEAEKSFQENVTRRWEADMASKQWLPSNIRPLMLLTLTAVTLTFIGIDATDAAGFTLGEGHLDLLQYLTMTAFGAYFAGRSYEKTKK